MTFYDNYGNAAPFGASVDPRFGVELWTWTGSAPGVAAANASLALLSLGGGNLLMGSYAITRAAQYVLRLVDWRDSVRRTLYSDGLTYTSADLASPASPLAVTVRAGTVSAAKSALVTPSLLGTSLQVPTIKLGVKTADAYGNPVGTNTQLVFTVRLAQSQLGISLSPLSSAFDPTLPGYIYTFNVTRSATYTATAYRSGALIANGSAAVIVTPSSAVAARLRLPPSALTSTVAGLNATVVVTGVDAYGNDVRSTSDAFQLYSSIATASGDVVSGTTSLVSMSAVPGQPGNYSASVVPTVAVAASGGGGLTFIVRLLQSDVASLGPLSVAPGPINADRCGLKLAAPSGTLSDSLTSVAAGTLITAQLTPRDAWGNTLVNATVISTGFTLRVDGQLTNLTHAVDGTFSASFILTRAGSHGVAASAGGSAFYDLATAVEIVPDVPDMTQAVVSMQSSYLAGALSSLNFTLRDKFGNALTALQPSDQFRLVVSASSAVASSKVFSVNPFASGTSGPSYNFSATSGLLSVSFAVTLAGTVSLNYRLAAGASLFKDPVNGLFYSAQIVNGPAVAEHTLVNGQCLSFGAVTGVQSTLYLQACDAYDNLLPAQASGTFAAVFSVYEKGSTTSYGSVNSSIVYDATRAQYALSFTPPAASTSMKEPIISANITYAGVPVSASPLSIKLIAEAGPPAAALSVVVDESGQAVATKNVLVMTAGGSLTRYLLIADANGVPVPSAVAIAKIPSLGARVNNMQYRIYNTSGKVALTLTSTVASDKYNVYVYMDSNSKCLANARPNTPLQVSVIAGPTASLFVGTRSGASALPSPYALTAGGLSYASIQPRDAYGNARSWTVSTAEHFSAVLQCASQNVSVAVADLESTLAKYELSFTPFVAGTCTLLVNLGNALLSSAPVTVSPAAFSAAYSRVFMPDLLATTAGQAFGFSLFASDAYGNSAAASERIAFLVNAVSLDGSVSVVGSQLQEFSDSGRYTARVVPTVAGVYALSVKEARYADVFVGQSWGATSFQFSVAAGPVSPSKSLLSGSGLISGKAGVNSSFFLSGSDAYGNFINATALSNGSVSFGGAIPVFTFSLGSNSTALAASVDAVTDAWGRYVARVRFTPSTCTAPYAVAFGATAVCSASYLNIEATIGGLAVTGSPSSAFIQPADAPQLLSATMSDSLVQIGVTFDIATNRAGMGLADTDCSRVLSASTLAKKLGAGPKCSFSADAMQLIIVLGSGATILPSGTLSKDLTEASPNSLDFLLGAVLNAAGNSYAYAALDGTPGTALLQGPPAAFDINNASALNPLPSLSAPRSVGVCEPLKLDASASGNSGGRALTFAFSVDFPPVCKLQSCPKLATLKNKLATLDSFTSIVAFDRNELDAGITFNFTVLVSPPCFSLSLAQFLWKMYLPFCVDIF